MNLWLKDPKTSEQSVSLTVLAVSVLIVVVSIVLQSMGKADSTGAAENFFLGAAGLYFGRKFTSSKGQSLEKPE